ncbi:MAG: GGDEF domain-containing protein [Atopobiaceae bacterium]|jgi:putative two-component system response regulator|nr:GGDEF domain-containing protein [Atopobiaceae bacterium]
MVQLPMDTFTDKNDSTDPHVLTFEGLKIRLRELSTFFDVVRLVNPIETCELHAGKFGLYPIKGGACYEIWGKDHQCSNCISRRVMKTKGRASKFELIGDEMYYVISSYVKVEGSPHAIEAISDVYSGVQVDVRDNENLVELVELSNKELYTDSLTGTYNRRYYDEQLAYIPVQGVAMIDIDDFKRVNDSYGHPYGDAILADVAETLMKNVRPTDIVARYGGDEFIVVFPSIPTETFTKRLEDMRTAVENLRFKVHPEVHITISCGGIHSLGTAPALIPAADKLLYQAKQKRNVVITKNLSDSAL